MKFLDTKIQ